jgi:hypothetical protein
MSHESRFRGILMMVQCHDADGLSPEELWEVARICVSRFSIDQLRRFTESAQELCNLRILNQMERDQGGTHAP